MRLAGCRGGGSGGGVTSGAGGGRGQVPEGRLIACEKVRASGKERDRGQEAQPSVWAIRRMSQPGQTRTRQQSSRNQSKIPGKALLGRKATTEYICG